MSSNPLSLKLFGELIQAAEVNAVRDLRQFEAGYVELVELLGAFRARLDSGRVLDCLSQ
jgi:hypothetical protein